MNPLLAFRHRFPWLLCNIAGGILAALSGVYQEELAWGGAAWLCSSRWCWPWPRASAFSRSAWRWKPYTDDRRPGRHLHQAGHELLTGLFLGAASLGHWHGGLAVVG